jgi:PAS domain S-box-containing protein
VLHEKYSESIISMSESGSFSVDALLPKLKGGLKSNIKAAPILDEDGRVKGAIQIIQDIGEGEEGSKSGELSIDQGFGDSLFAIYKVNSKGTISEWNKVCEKIFGLPLSKVIGKSPASLVPKAYRPKVSDTILRALNGESFKGLEWKYATGTDKPVYMLVRVQPVPEQAGEGQECYIINTDITALKLRLKTYARRAVDNEEKLKKVTKNYNLLTKNIATIIRKKKKEDQETTS